MDLSRRSPRFSLIRLSASAGVFLWLTVFLQFQLVNVLSWSPLLLLLLGGAGFLVLGTLGGLFGGLLGLSARRLPRRALLTAAAFLIPLAAGFLGLLLPVLTSDTFAARKAVLASGTWLALLLGGAGLGIALLAGRRLRAPLPTLLGILAAWISAGFLAREPAAATRPEKEVRASLKKDAPAAARLLIFGSDGLEWSVLRDLMDRGELPHFRQVMQRGIHAPFQTMEPTLSPLIWTTLATGVPWEQHGVREFLWFHLPGAACDAGWTGTFLEPLIRRVGRQSSLFLPYIRMTGTVHRWRLAFWDVLDLAREDCAVVDWWGTQPPVAGNGFQVSDQCVEQALHLADDLQTHPEARNRLEALLRASVAPEDQWESVAKLFQPQRLAAFREEARHLLEGVDFGLPGGMPEKQSDRFTRALIHGEIVRQRLAAGKEEVCVFYDRLTDQISHLFWQFYRPDEPEFTKRRPSPEAVAGLKDMVPAAYRTADQILGRLLEAAGEDANVLILSDHGFRAVPPARAFIWGAGEANPPRSGDHLHGEPGVFLLAGPHVCAGNEPGRISIFDFAPTVFYLRGLPSADNLPGHVIRQAFCRDWLDAHPPRKVPTFEYPGWRSRNLEAAAADAGMLQDLKELGYL